MTSLSKSIPGKGARAGVATSQIPEITGSPARVIEPFAGSMAGKLWNRNQVEAVPLTELHLPSRQVRRLVERQITKLAASINRFDFIVPVLATEDGELITGTARAEAARRCGLEIIPVIRITHLSPKEIRAFRIADNRLVELGEWDEEKLAIELKELSALDLDFSLELIHPPKGPVRSRSIYSL